MIVLSCLALRQSKSLVSSNLVTSESGCLLRCDFYLAHFLENANHVTFTIGQKKQTGGFPSFLQRFATLQLAFPL